LLKEVKHFERILARLKVQIITENSNI